MRKDAVTM